MTTNEDYKYFLSTDAWIYLVSFALALFTGWYFDQIHTPFDAIIIVFPLSICYFILIAWGMGLLEYILKIVRKSLNR